MENRRARLRLASSGRPDSPGRRRLGALRGAVVGLTLLGGATACGSIAPLAAGAARLAPHTSARCTTADVVVWLNTQGNGTAGSTYYRLEFTNLSATTCTLGGFPGVSGVTLAGKQLGSSATEDGAAGKTVSLAPGASANALVRITDTGVYSSAQCRSKTAAGLRVYPPGSTAAEFAPFPFSACSAAAHYLAVESVTSGLGSSN